MGKEKNLYAEAMGLLIPKGFTLEKGEDGKWVIKNRAGNHVAEGDLKTMYYAACYIAGDETSDRLQDPLPNANKAYQRGLEMARRLRAKGEK